MSASLSSSNNSLSVALSHAVSFLTRPLLLRYPTTTTTTLERALEGSLGKYYSASWVCSEPARGSGRRCLTLSPDCAPPRPIYAACGASGVEWAVWIAALGGVEMDLFVDPGRVFVRLPKTDKSFSVWSASAQPKPASPLSLASAPQQPQQPRETLRQRRLRDPAIMRVAASAPVTPMAASFGPISPLPPSFSDALPAPPHTSDPILAAFARLSASPILASLVHEQQQQQTARKAEAGAALMCTLRTAARSRLLRSLVVQTEDLPDVPAPLGSGDSVGSDARSTHSRSSSTSASSDRTLCSDSDAASDASTAATSAVSASPSSPTKPATTTSSSKPTVRFAIPVEPAPQRASKAVEIKAPSPPAPPATSEPAAPGIYKTSRRERARQKRAGIVVNHQTPATQYEEGRTSVLTGGVMLGGARALRASAARA